MKTRTKFNIALWGLVVIALAGFFWVQVAAPLFEKDLADTLGHGDYHLAMTDGGTFTEDSLRGQPSAVFFGFTHCPEVCPTTLGDIATWQEDLGAEGPLDVFFVTVDPERDSLDQLRDYVSWVPGVRGVSGTPEETAKALKAFRGFARKVPLEGGGYTMDHSAYVLLFDANGRMFEPIGYQEEYDRAIGKIRTLVGS